MTLDEAYPGPWALLLVPLCGPDHGCASPGKTPHRTGWQREALARYENGASRETWLAHIQAHIERGGNVGLCIPPYVVAFDCDTDMDGGKDFTKRGFACDAIMVSLPDYPVQRTGGRVRLVDEDGYPYEVAHGVHLIAASPVPEPLGSHYDGVPITIRKARNQIVVWPSVHASGERYGWLTELPLHPDALPEIAPHKLEHRTKSGVSRSYEGETQSGMMDRVSEEWLDELLDPDVIFGPGRRHEAMLWFAWHMTVCGLSQHEVHCALEEFTDSRCTWGDRRPTKREVEDIVRGGFARYAHRTGG